MSNTNDFVIQNKMIKKYTGQGGNVVIPDGVKSIRHEAFQDCKQLISIVIPESVTRIGDYAFAGCSNLKYVKMESEAIQFGDWVFFGCDPVISMPHWNEKLERLLTWNDKMLLIHTEDPLPVIPVKYRRRALLGFILTDQDLSTERAKSYLDYAKRNSGKMVEDAFEYPALLSFLCENKLIAAKDVDTYTAESEKHADTEKKALLLDYQNRIGSENVSKARAKKEKTKEEYTDALIERISKRDPSKGIEGMSFVITGKLASWKSRGEIERYLKLHGANLCNSISRDTDYLVTNDKDSGSAKNKKAQDLGAQVISESEFNQMIGKQYCDAEIIAVPEWIKEIPGNAFKGCVSMTEVIIPEGVTCIANNAFLRCHKLERITIPKTVTSIGSNAFSECESLNNIVIPEQITSIGDYAFEFCENLVDVKISGATSIGDYAFDACINLKNVTVSENVTSIGRNAFRWCSVISLHGAEGSYAEKYAKKNKIPFISE